MEVYMDCLAKLQSTKVQKVQKVKKYIKNKNTKIEMYKCTEIQKMQNTKKHKYKKNGCKLLVQKVKERKS